MRDFPTGAVRDGFASATALLSNEQGPGQAALRSGSRQVNAALAEAVLVGLLRRLDVGTAPEPHAVATAVKELHASAELQPAISQATADEEAVRTRLAVATQVFASA